MLDLNGSSVANLSAEISDSAGGASTVGAAHMVVATGASSSAVALNQFVVSASTSVTVTLSAEASAAGTAEVNDTLYSLPATQMQVEVTPY